MHLGRTAAATLLDFELRDVTAFLLLFGKRHTQGEIKKASAAITTTYEMAFNVNPLNPRMVMQDQIAYFVRKHARRTATRKERPVSGFDMYEIVDNMVQEGPSSTASGATIINRITILFRGMIGVRAMDLAKMAFTEWFATGYDITDPGPVTLHFYLTKTTGSRKEVYWDSITLAPMSVKRIQDVYDEGNMNIVPGRANDIVQSCCPVRALHRYWQLASEAIRERGCAEVLHGRKVIHRYSMLWTRGFDLVTKQGNARPLRFLSSSTINGYVKDYHQAHIKSAVVADGITVDGNWVAHTWRANALSTLGHTGHRQAARDHSFHNNDATFKRYYDMPVSKSFSFRVEHIIDRPSFKRLQPLETLLF